MIYQGCLLAEEVFTDPFFCNWIEDQDDAILAKFTSEELYRLFLETEAKK